MGCLNQRINTYIHANNLTTATTWDSCHGAQGFLFFFTHFFQQFLPFSQSDWTLLFLPDKQTDFSSTEKSDNRNVGFVLYEKNNKNKQKTGRWLLVLMPEMSFWPSNKSNRVGMSLPITVGCITVTHTHTFTLSQKTFSFLLHRPDPVLPHLSSLFVSTIHWKWMS